MKFVLNRWNFSRDATDSTTGTADASDSRTARGDEPAPGFGLESRGHKPTLALFIDRMDLVAGGFEPYFSGKRTSSRSGSGLGLAIVHGVVKEHGGFIDVVSEVGCGTTFVLYLPTTNERPIDSNRCSSTAAASARIWVVDDNPVQLRTARRVLHALGYEVRAFAHAEPLMQQMRRCADSHAALGDNRS